MSLCKAEAIFCNIINQVIQELLWHYISKLHSSGSSLSFTTQQFKENKTLWLHYIYEAKLVNLLLIRSPAETSLVGEES